jgi:hypothetical protein
MGWIEPQSGPERRTLGADRTRRRVGSRHLVFCQRDARLVDKRPLWARRHKQRGRTFSNEPYPNYSCLGGGEPSCSGPLTASRIRHLLQLHSVQLFRMHTGLLLYERQPCHDRSIKHLVVGGTNAQPRSGAVPVWLRGHAGGSVVGSTPRLWGPRVMQTSAPARGVKRLRVACHSQQRGLV